MQRFAFTTAALLGSLALAPGAFAQTAKATPATPQAAPAASVARARMATPVKGTAYIEVIQGPSKTIGKDVVTVTTIKNVSNAPIAGLRVDEFWYDSKMARVTGDTERVRAPVAPGEIVEVTTRSPVKPGLYRAQWTYNHANGAVKPKVVKKFTS